MNETRTSLALAAAAAGAAFHDLLAPERIFWGSTAPSLRPRNQRQRRRDDRRVRPHGRKGGR